MASGHVPALATALCTLALIDFTAAPAAPESEKTFHEWLQAELPLAQVQFVYNSALYQGLLATRFDKYFGMAQQADMHRSVCASSRSSWNRSGRARLRTRR